jgi:hypothetical protein
MKINSTDHGLELIPAEPIPFRSLPHPRGAGHEIDLEELLARHIDFMLGEADEPQDTLLIIGRQVRTTTQKRMDLVAIDATGALVVIEVKRDPEDMKVRRDNGEMQAIRYAASLANLQTPEDLVQSLLLPYYRANGWVLDGVDQGGRTLEEYARYVMSSFISKNDISEEELNHHQRIILVGAQFDDDTTSAAAWLASNGLPIEVYAVNPQRVAGEYFLNSTRIIPTDPLDDFYTQLPETNAAIPILHSSNRTRKIRIRLGEMITKGIVQPGDLLYFKDLPNQTCKIVDGTTGEANGQLVSYPEWAKQQSGWQAVNIYEWLIHVPTGQRLEDLRIGLERQFVQEVPTP